MRQPTHCTRCPTQHSTHIVSVDRQPFYVPKHLLLPLLQAVEGAVVLLPRQLYQRLPKEGCLCQFTQNVRCACHAKYGRGCAQDRDGPHTEVGHNLVQQRQRQRQHTVSTVRQERETQHGFLVRCEQQKSGRMPPVCHWWLPAMHQCVLATSKHPAQPAAPKQTTRELARAIRPLLQDRRLVFPDCINAKKI